MRLSKRSITSVLQDIDIEFLKPNGFEVMQKGTGFLIQFKSWMIDRETNEASWQKGGKHYISSYATKTEVVFKALKACLDFAEHEVREAFYYKGATISNPHTDIEKLVKFQEKKPIISRKDIRGLNESELSNI